MPTRHLALSLLVACACARVHTDTTTPGAPSVANDDALDAPAATPPEGAQRTASGLAYLVLVPGTGSEHPGPTSEVRVHYAAWTASDGVKFDDSYARGEPLSVTPDVVIPGWGEAVQLMVVGETMRVWIPEHLAYQGKPNMPAGTLVFDIELLELTPARQ